MRLAPNRPAGADRLKPTAWFPIFLVVSVLLIVALPKIAAPFFRFFKGGLNVPLGAVVRNVGLLLVLLFAKMVPKLALIYPLARRAIPQHATFTTLLMSTGLTFGTVSSLYGLRAGIIDETQFSLLIPVVVLSAVVPTFVAERWFLPAREERKSPEAAPIPAEEYV